jgi:hypothetical protein
MLSRYDFIHLKKGKVKGWISSLSQSTNIIDDKNKG